MDSYSNYECLVSIIVPVYNTEPYIDRCLQTIVNQTYRKLEIIIVNDGSRDNSLSKCSAWAMKDERIVVVDQHNKGLSEARNTGLVNSHGEYICFVDSDDWLDLDFIEHLLFLATKHCADVVSCGFDRTSINTRTKQTKKIKVVRGSSIFSWIIESAIKGDSSNVSCCTKLYKRSLIINERFQSGLIYEDIVFNALIAKKSNILIKSFDKKYKYFINNFSITTNSFSKKNYDLVVGAEIIRNSCLDDDKLVDLCDKYLAKCHFSLVVKMIKSGMVDKESFLKEYYCLKNNIWLLFSSCLSFLRKAALLLLVLTPKPILIRIAGRNNGKI